jgi:hypothetical protein
LYNAQRANLSADHMLQQIVVRDATLAEIKKGDAARREFIQSIVDATANEDFSEV